MKNEPLLRIDQKTIKQRGTFLKIRLDNQEGYCETRGIKKGDIRVYVYGRDILTYIKPDQIIERIFNKSKIKELKEESMIESQI